MTELVTVRESLEVLARGSKSFRFASHFLPADRRGEAALLYAFCRLVDDLADDAPSPEVAQADLDAVVAELDGAAPARPVIGALIELSARRGLDLRHAHELVRGVRSDLEPVRVKDDGALLRYCYRVAGTVGLMMSPIIGVTDGAAAPFALDLGIGMQLTNICRDVAEDARLGRVYLPASRLEAVGVSQDDLLQGRPGIDGGVRRVVQDLLLLAERYYASADRGLRYIPLRPRAAILVASRVYREIGRRLLANGADALAGRTVVSGGRKVWVAAGALAALGSPRVFGFGRPRHLAALHSELVGLPGADEGAPTPRLSAALDGARG